MKHGVSVLKAATSGGVALLDSTRESPIAGNLAAAGSPGRPTSRTESGAMARSPEDFVQFYDAHYMLALQHAIRRLRDRDLAEEIVAAAFFQMLRAHQRRRWPEIPAAAWVYRVVTNEIRRHFRWTTAYRRALQNWFARRPQRVARATTTDEWPEFEQVRQAVATLPERYCSVLALRYFERLSTPEIAVVHRADADRTRPNETALPPERGDVAGHEGGCT